MKDSSFTKREIIVLVIAGVILFGLFIAYKVFPARVMFNAMPMVEYISLICVVPPLGLLIATDPERLKRHKEK